MIFFRPIFFLIILIFLSIVCYAQAEQKPIPRFERSECAVKVPEDVRTECGNLFVRESRNSPKSREIRLPVIIIKSTSANPASDPIFYTAGGPGGSSMGRARGAKGLQPYTKDRDFIIFEQRGTTFADPNMACPEVNDAHHLAAEKSMDSRAALATELDGVRRCRERLIRDGVNIALYDSASSAADMEDLRRVLGIMQWNLYGISYSTRLMLNYIRDYPTGVRSVILDSVLPTAVNYDETSVDGVMASLRLIFSGCEKDTACSARYPKLEQLFFEMVKDADKSPIVVEVTREGRTVPIKINGKAVVDFIYNLLEDTSALPDIPFIIDRLASGKQNKLISFRRFAENKLTSQGFVWGARYSVWCREEMPFQNLRLIRSQWAKYKQLVGFGIQETFPEICKVWNVPPAKRIENEPVKSDIPALIFSGEYDPDTPPAWGRLTASWFKNSYFFEVKNTSHGPLFSDRCSVTQIVLSFLGDPTKRPSDSCLAREPLKFNLSN